MKPTGFEIFSKMLERKVLKNCKKVPNQNQPGMKETHN